VWNSFWKGADNWIHSFAYTLPFPSSSWFSFQQIFFFAGSREKLMLAENSFLSFPLHPLRSWIKRKNFEEVSERIGNSFAWIIQILFLLVKAYEERRVTTFLFLSSSSASFDKPSAVSHRLCLAQPLRMTDLDLEELETSIWFYIIGSLGPTDSFFSFSIC